MELALAVLAVVSLLMTLGMGTVTWRLLRDERQRSEARIAALVAALDGDRAAPPLPAGLGPPEDAGATGRPAQVAGLAAAAGLVLAVVLVTVIGLREAGGEGSASGASGASGAPAAQAAMPPIELLALEHEPAGAMLAIRGSMRVAGAAAAGPGAVLATALDAAGATVASRRVDLPSLAPGAESRFTVEVPAASVTRYRISFLRGDVTVPHVDLRASAQGVGAASEELDGAGGAS